MPLLPCASLLYRAVILLAEMPCERTAMQALKLTLFEWMC